MSQANIPNITPTISLSTAQTVPLLLASVALEELALAHLVNAEAEKLQLVLGTLTPTRTTFSPATVNLSNLLTLDSSVQRTLRDVIKKEMLLEFKFENILDLIASGAAAVTPPPSAVCGCGVSLLSGVTFGPISVIVLGLDVAVTSGTLNFVICSNCQEAGSFFDLTLAAAVALGFTLNTITSVTCVDSVATITGTATVTVDGFSPITGDLTIVVNGNTGTVTVTVTTGSTTVLSATIPVPVADIVFATCP